MDKVCINLQKKKKKKRKITFQNHTKILIYFVFLKELKKDYYIYIYNPLNNFEFDCDFGCQININL